MFEIIKKRDFRIVDILKTYESFDEAVMAMDDLAISHMGVNGQLEIGDTKKRRICAVTEFKINGKYRAATLAEALEKPIEKKTLEKIIRIIPQIN